MKSPQEMSDAELIQAEFARRFGDWDIPTEKLDALLAKEPNESRQTHYLELKQLLASKAFKREIREWLRRVSRTLSMGCDRQGKELEDIHRLGLRYLMIEIEEFEKTLEKRATLLTPPKPLRPLSSKV